MKKVEIEATFVDVIEGMEVFEEIITTEDNVFEIAYDLGYQMEYIWSIVSDKPFNKKELLKAFDAGLDQ